MNLILTISYALSVILLLVISYLVLLYNPKLYIKQTLSFFFFSVIGFLLCMYFGYYFAETNSNYTVWFIRGTFASAIILGHALIALAYYYPLVTFRVPKWTRRVLVFLTCLVVIISFTDLIYEKEILIEGGIEDLHGDLHGYYLILSLSYLITSVVFFVKKILSVESVQRKKTQLVSIGGISYALLLAIVYPILPRFNIYVLQREAILFGGVLAALIFYSMLKYRFLDVRFTITRIVKQGFSVLFTILFVTGIWGLMQLSPLLMEYQVVLMPALYVIAIFMYFYILRGFVSDIFHIFFGLTSVEHFRDSLEKFTKQSTLYTTVEEFNTALKDLFQSVYIESVNIIPLDKKNQKKYASFVHYFEKNPEILVNNERPFLSKNRRIIPKNRPRDLTSLGGICIPLFRSPKVILGFLVLGNKKFHDLYSTEEVLILEEFKHFLELRMVGILYSDFLKREVEKKTESLHRKNKELKELNEKLQMLDESKDTFLAIASHELRTPMTVISGFADLLLSDGFDDLNEKQKTFLGNISKSSKDLTNFVNQMLDINILTANKMEFKCSDIFFPQVLEEMKQEFEIICQQKDLSFEFDNPYNLTTTIWNDSFQLRRILHNLIGNSVKFTPAGGKITLRIERCNQQTKCVKISVTDTGIGIPKEDQEMIFKKFHRTKHSGKVICSGTGLGLNIVKLLVGKLGGEISVKSEKDKGSCFTFLLPDYPK